MMGSSDVTENPQYLNFVVSKKSVSNHHAALCKDTISNQQFPMS